MTEIPSIYLDDALALARHALTTLAGVLVTRGWIASDETSMFVQLAIGVLMFAGTLAMSWYQKFRSHQQTVVALAAAKLPLTAVQDRIANASPLAPIPSVLTKADQVPIVIP